MSCLYCEDPIKAIGLCSMHYDRWLRRRPMDSPRGYKYTRAGFRDITNQRFGRWLVINREGNNPKYGTSRWRCRCDCGNVKIVSGAVLHRGESQSCGCYHSDCARQVIENRTRHGESRGGKVTPEYYTWNGMKRRCDNPNSKFYDYYGGRGIKVCDRWVSSYESFLEDMGRRPSKNHSLDRVDPNGNYEPSNCRWATRSEQNKNTRANYYLTEVVRLSKLLAHYREKFGELNAG